MKKSKKNFSAIILTIVSIVLVLSILLCACTDTPQTEEQEQEVVNNDSNENESSDSNGDQPDSNLNENLDNATLKVTFDENATYSLTDLANISNLIRVEYEADGTRSAVENYTVSSAELSADGQYIEVVISANGLERTVMLPYFAHKPLIHDELLPLYTLLSEEGGKGFSLTISGADGAEESFSVNAILNVLEEGIQFALQSNSEEENKVIALFNDDVLYIGGMEINVNKLTQIISAFSDEDEIEAEAEETDDVEDADEEDDLKSTFIALSSALYAINELPQNNLFRKMDISFTKENGVYSLTVDTKTLLDIFDLYYEYDETGINLYDVIDYIDEELDGALKAGDIVLNLSLTIAENGIEIAASCQNEVTEIAYLFDISFEVSDEGYELPEVSDMVTSDIVISIPFALPQNNIDVLFSTVIHISDMFAEDGKDYITSAIKFNNENILLFNLNDNYFYLDATGLTALMADEDPSTAATVSFYQAFEIDGEPVSLFEFIMANSSSSVEEHEEPEQPFSCGYCLQDGYDNLVFDIGATEQDLRDRLCVSYGEEDNYTDYTIVGFDSSNSAYLNNVKLLFDEGDPDDEYDDKYLEIEVVICDLTNATLRNISLYDNLYIPLNSSVSDVDPDIQEVEGYFSDGTTGYYGPVTGVAITKVIIGGDVIDITDENKNTPVFTTAGDCIIWLVHDEVETFAAVYVYDPENLVATKIEAPYSVTVTEDADEDAIRAKLDELDEDGDGGVWILYDDGETQNKVLDYEIEFTPGDSTATITWEDLELQVWVNYEHVYEPEEKEEDFDIMKIVQFLRFAVIDENDLTASLESSFDALKTLYEENKEMLDTIFTINEADDDVSIRIIVNASGDEAVDLISFINLFIGLPNPETGEFVDIDEDTVSFILSNALDNEENSFADTFENIVGVSLHDVLSEFVVDAGTAHADGGIGVYLALSNGDQVQYMATGILIKFVDNVEQFNLTEDMIENAGDMEALATFFQLFFPEEGMSPDSPSGK